MANTAPSHLWFMRLAYLGLCLLVILLHLLPLDTMPRVWAPPDWLMVFTFAWALRRPDYVPILSIAVIFLTADLLFQRPPGLMAALMLIGTEYLRLHFAGLRDASFVGEWIAVCVICIAILIANRVTLGILASYVPPLGPSLIQALLTMLAYPLAVFASQVIMGVRRPDPRDGERRGIRA